MTRSAALPSGARQAAARGRLRGLGIACFLETSRGTPGERAEIRFEPDGQVALVLGTQSNGQGHETSYAQIAADLLGLPIDAFRYVQADTREVKSGNGHGGARSMHMGGAALHQAAQMVIAKGRSPGRPPAAGRPGARSSFAGRPVQRSAAASAASICSSSPRPRATRPICRTA